MSEEASALRAEFAKVRDELVQQYGAVHAYAIDGQLVVVRKLSEGEYLRASKRLKNSKDDASLAEKELALSVIVLPQDHQAKRDILKEHPNCIGDFADKAMDLSRRGVIDLGND